MAELVGKRFENADEVREFTDGKGRVDLVDLKGGGDGLGTFEAGWRCQRTSSRCRAPTRAGRTHRLSPARPYGAEDG